MKDNADKEYYMYILAAYLQGYKDALEDSSDLLRQGNYVDQIVDRLMINLENKFRLLNEIEQCEVREC